MPSVRRRFTFAFCATAAVFAPSVLAALPVPPTPSAVRTACKPGTDPVTGGSTATSLRGATIVSAKEARCIIDKFGKAIVVVAAMSDAQRLENAVVVVTEGRNADEWQSNAEKRLAAATEGRKDRPLIIYCHHSSCGLSESLSNRAVKAGYQQVYWMRSGMSGWKAAEYPTVTKAVERAQPKPAPPPRPASARAADIVADCHGTFYDFDAEDYAGLLHQMPTVQEQVQYFEKDRAEEARMVDICISNRLPRNDADLSAALQAGRAKVRATIDAQFNAAKREVENNPAKYLSMTWDSHQPAKLRADLATLRNGKTIAQKCGTFDLAQPPIGYSYNSRNAQLSRRRKEFGACITEYRSDLSTVGKTFGLTSANEWVKATRPFTCRAARRPNCIPNEPYDTIASIATDQNAAFAERQDKLFSAERGRVNGMIDALNAWIARLNERIDAANRR